MSLISLMISKQKCCGLRAREALRSSDLVLAVGVTEMNKICHGRASGGLHPNERLSPSTQVTIQVKITDSHQAKCCLPRIRQYVTLWKRGCILRCGLGNRPRGDKMEEHSRHRNDPEQRPKRAS